MNLFEVSLGTPIPRGGDVAGEFGDGLAPPKKFEMGGRPIHPSPQYFEK